MSEVHERPGREGSRTRAFFIHLRPILKRWFQALLILECAYVIGANSLLRTSWLEKQVNERPDHFALRWSQAWTWFPGSVEMEDVTYIGQGSRDVYYGHMDRCSFHVRPAWLLSREVRCDRFRAVGFDFRLSEHRGESSEAKKTQAHYPPIPGLADLPRRQVAGARNANSRWRFLLEDIELQSVEQLWFKNACIVGPGMMKGSLEQDKDGVFQAEVKEFEMLKGSIKVAGTPALRPVRVQLSGGLAPVRFDSTEDSQIYRAISARVKARGEVRDLALAGRRLGRGDQISLQGGGVVDLDVRVDRGLYSVGSWVNLDSKTLKLRMGSYVWEGESHLTERIELIDGRPTARLRGRLSGLEFATPSLRRRELGGAEILLESEARDLRMLGEFADASLKIHISPMRIQDPVALNPWIPEPFHSAFREGAITASAELVRNADQTLHGQIALSGRELGAEYRGADFKVDVAMNANFGSDPALEHQIRLTNTWLIVSNLTSVASPRAVTKPGWVAEVSLAQASLSTETGWDLQSQVLLSTSEVEPILRLLRAQSNAPSWLKWIPTVRDLKGSARVGLSSQVVDVEGMDFHGSGTELLGNLRFRGGDLTGILYARFGILSLGLDLRQKDRSWKMMGARRWFDRVLSGGPEWPEPATDDRPLLTPSRKP